MASDQHDASGLTKDDVVAGARLADLVAAGERISCWRARRSDGTPATVHCLARDAAPRERDNFLTAARRLASLARTRPIRGVVEVVAVVPTELVYVARGGAQGTMEDVFVLGWGVKDVVSFTRKVCRALRELHQLGVPHGCLRPANVLLDDELHPRLSDAGALVIDDSYDGPSDMKHDYAAYAAREVRLGQKPDVRSDVFSVGRLLYFALGGEVPDEGDEDLPLLAALSNHPAGLVRIIRRCTTRDPSRRYQSLDQLIADLELWEDAAKVGLRHPRGQEGAAGEASEDDEPPVSGRGSVRPPPPAASSRDAAASTQGEGGEAAPSKSAGEVQLALGPAYISEPEDDDFISPEQMRIFGVLGAILVVGGLAFAYSTAAAIHLATIGVMLGAVGISLTIPPFGRALVVSRLVAALLLGLVAWLVDPVGLVAEAGRMAKLSAASPTERALRVEHMRRRGFTNFTGLDLRGADFSGMDLTGSRLDASDLTSAKLVGARLNGASVSDTKLTGADLSGADLSGVEVGASRGWLETICSEATVMPAQWQCIDGQPNAMGTSIFPEAPSE